MDTTETPPRAVKPNEPEGTRSGLEPENYLQSELYELVRADPAIFEFLQAGSLDGIWYWDLTDPDSEWMSQRFWEVFGWDPKTKRHLASEWQDMIFAEDLDVVMENFHRHSEDPTHPYDQVVRYRHRDGSTVWVRCRGIVIRDEAGNPSRMLGAHTDVSALKEAQAELERRTAELEELNRELADTRSRLEEELSSKDKFVATVSHELRTPLTAMIGFAELLREEGPRLDPADRTEMIETITGQGVELSYLVEDLLVSARAEAGTLSIAQVPVNLRAQTSQVLEAWAPELLGDVRLYGDSVRAIADPVRVRQIVRNLVSNAIRYGGDKIEISIGTNGSSTHIVVSDDGPAIEPRDVEVIFEPYQVATGSSPAVGSVGLGLPVSRQLARLMNGELLYRHSEGSSEFVLTLPVHEDS